MTRSQQRASSSRSQVAVRAASAMASLTCNRQSVSVRWHPSLAVLIVIQLVTRPRPGHARPTVADPPIDDSDRCRMDHPESYPLRADENVEDHFIRRRDLAMAVMPRVLGQSAQADRGLPMPAIYPGPIPPVMNALHGAHTFRLQRHASQHYRSWPGYGVHAVGTSSIRRLGGPRFWPIRVQSPQGLRPTTGRANLARARQPPRG